MPMQLQEACPVCAAAAVPLDVVDFNKSCAEQGGKWLPLAGRPVYYFLCGACGHCFAPELCCWSPDEFAGSIYNAGYVEVDPDYLDRRPRAGAASLLRLFGEAGPGLRHLDYGSGTGRLGELLRESGWQTVSHDPFAAASTPLADGARFDLITAYEVFEHVPDPKLLIDRLAGLLADDGVILLSTLLSDGFIAPRQRLGWWYASPRNGHISLFSKKSLGLLAARQKFIFGSFSVGVHAMWRQVPVWARHVIRGG